MQDFPLLAGIRATMIQTARLRTHLLESGPEHGERIMFVHGNCSAARFWEETMLALPAPMRAIAPDMRGYGRSEQAPVDAIRGVRDFSDDLAALIQTLGLERVHLVGWSLGGAVVMQYTIDHPNTVASLTLVAPGSPYGYGGSRDLEGTPTTPDFASCGGGGANPEFVQRMSSGDRSGDSPSSPRNVMNSFYFKPPFRAEREEVFVDEVNLTKVSPDNYPGDSVAVTTWPGFAPGTRGINNALSAKYCDLSAFAQIEPQPPVLWIRGDSDQIVSDTSLFDLGYLGQLGVIPGWPGAEQHPPQPMVSQTRAVLDRYASRGGQYREIVLEGCGHSPQIERPSEFGAALRTFLETLRSTTRA